MRTSTYITLPCTADIVKVLREWSFAIIIVGAQLGIYLNILVVNWNWNNILMPVSMLFLPNWRNLCQLKFPSMTTPLKWMALFFLFIWAHILFRPLSSYMLGLFLYATALAFCVSSLNASDVSIRKIIKKVWGVTFICAIIGFYMQINGIFTQMATASDDDIAKIVNLSQLVLGNGCCIGMASALCYPKRSRRMNWIVVVSILFDLFVILFLGKRTGMVCAIVMLLVYAMVNKKVNMIKIIRGFVILLLSVTILVLLLDNWLHITEQFNHMVEYLSAGIYDMSHGTTTSGNISARYRYRYINAGIGYINQVFTPINYIIGGGPMAAKMTDVPILQSFVDLGIIGFIGYSFYVIIFPLISLVKYKQYHNIMFACFLGMYNIVSCMNSGHPYGMGKYWPAIFIAYVIYCQNARKVPLKN